MTDILDEVESDYNAERLRAAAMRYAWVVGAVLVAALVGAGGWQWWQSHRQQQDTAAASVYLADTKAADALIAGDVPGRVAVAKQLTDFAATAPAGYRGLAQLRAAALLADAGRLAAAQDLWDAIGHDPNADPLIRQAANYLWVNRGLDSADPAALRTRLLTLTSPDNAFHALAVEALAMLDLRQNQTEAARTLLRRLVADPSAPSGARQRDEAILTRLGG